MIRTRIDLLQLAATTSPCSRTRGTYHFLLAAFAFLEHENRPDDDVGRLHYLLRSTLSAHFRWGIGASEVLTFAS